MQADEVKALVEAHIPQSEVTVEVSGSSYNLTVVSNAFDGLSSLKKQQLVYGALQEQIAAGAIHAVNMRTFTEAEWQKAKRFSIS